MKEELIKISNGTLTLHNHKLIKNINLQIFKKEVHGIILDNTEVKSFLIKILCGEGHLSYGKIYFQEELLKESDSNRVLRKNLVLIDQTRHLIPTLKIFENIFFSVFHPLYLNPRPYLKRAQSLFQYFDINIPINKAVKDLSIYECVIIELITAFALQRKLVILSNITSILNKNEINSIFDLVLQLKEKGMSFLVVQNIEDVKLRYNDRLTIVMGGRTIGVYDPKLISKEILYKIFYSDPENSEFFPLYNDNCDLEKVTLAFDNITDSVLDHISFKIHKSEIIRILYSDEESAIRLISILKGESFKTSGNIYLENNSYDPPTNNLNKKNEICFIEENSVERMIFKNLSIIDNLSYPLCNKIDGFWFNRKYKKSIELKLNQIIDPTILKKSTKNVSQDDLLKTVYCKLLLYNPKLLVCIKPFSVADAQNQLIEKMIALLAENGISILIITSSWPSFTAIQGKILYLRNGVLKEK